MNYSDIRPNINTGDIVLFSGNGFISNGIKVATNSKWSHVGMALKIPQYDFICIWESTSLNSVVDIETKKLTSGVQLSPLSERIRLYDGDVSIRHINRYDNRDTRSLMELRRTLSGRPYEKDKIELIMSAYDGPCGENAEDLSSLFCSELVAEAYQSMGYLGGEKPSNEYTPADFSDDERIALNLGAHLGKEIEVNNG